MKLIQLLENEFVSIKPSDIKIENGIMIPNQFPDKVDIFDCSQLKQLTSLENCPKQIMDFITCSDTNITSLDYAPLQCKTFRCTKNNIIHLKEIGRKYLKDCRTLILPDTIKSNILGLCRVKNLKFIEIEDKNLDLVYSGDLYDAIEIIENYLHKDIDDCAEELTQNGFNDYAKF
jgi:hypothetical protein